MCACYLGEEQKWPPAGAVGLGEGRLGLSEQTASAGHSQESLLGLPDVIILSVNREI